MSKTYLTTTNVRHDGVLHEKGARVGDKQLGEAAKTLLANGDILEIGDASPAGKKAGGKK